MTWSLDLYADEPPSCQDHPGGADDSCGLCADLRLLWKEAGFGQHYDDRRGGAQLILSLLRLHSVDKTMRALEEFRAVLLQRFPELQRVVEQREPKKL